MKYKKYKSENRFPLLARSMGKLHKVEYLGFSSEATRLLFDKFDMVSIAMFANRPDITLCAKDYAGDSRIELDDASTKERPFYKIYVETQKDEYHQVERVFCSAHEADVFIKTRTGVEVMDTIRCGEVHYFIVCSSKASKPLEDLL